jgi:hypothetical protein
MKQRGFGILVVVPVFPLASGFCFSQGEFLNNEIGGGYSVTAKTGTEVHVTAGQWRVQRQRFSA